MKSILISFFVFGLCDTGVCQNGYIKLDNDSTLVGFIRHYYHPNSREQFLEFWRTKNDKSPRRILRKNILEYAIQKDTFLVLRNFQPFPDEDVFIEIAEGKLLSNGRIQYLKVSNPYYKGNSAAAFGALGAGLSMALGDKVDKVQFIFALRERSNQYIRGIPKKKELFDEVLHDFFSDRAIESFEKQKAQKVNFKTLQDFVDYYNIKTKN